MPTRQALNRDGHAINRAGRSAVADTMRRLLAEGERYTAPEADFAPAELRAWAVRLRQLAVDLADCVEAPARNRVMEVLESSSIDDDFNALYILRLYIAGASPNQLGEEIDVAGRTIERIEADLPCRVDVAKKIADRFALSVTELFHHHEGPSGRDTLRVRSVGRLRDAIMTPGDTNGLRLLTDGFA